VASQTENTLSLTPERAAEAAWRPVFTGKSVMATILAQVNEQPRPPSERSELRIAPALDEIILECLAKDPAARPPSAVELGRRLAAAVPDDTWTPEKAHAWWELHYVSLRRGESSASAGARDEPAAATAERARCRPRLDRYAVRPGTTGPLDFEGASETIGGHHLSRSSESSRRV